MTAGDFSPTKRKVCRGCGRVGEWPGFLRRCPGCDPR